MLLSTCLIVFKLACLNRTEEQIKEKFFILNPRCQIHEPKLKCPPKPEPENE